MNETDTEKTVTLDRAYTDMLTGETLNGTLILSPCGFYIVTDKN